jgi:hypothetical protein
LFSTVKYRGRHDFHEKRQSFKRPADEPDTLEGCIEEFLGDDICSHPLVRNLTLSEDEKNSLELPFTEDELSLALDGANSGSSPGMDGISTGFIKRFWFLFRTPLTRYVSDTFRKRRLTNSFKGSIIKLIPKKGTAKDIRKWRPISLLSCMYKIISRAVNNRLKTVINRFTSHAQKGFSNHRYIQEVLINVCETINYCNVNAVGGGAKLSNYQSRAFYTIRHR